ncbi:acyl-CoA dehydrogenase family protein [Ornithinimicrobium faecis]|uniref:Acyl-CoA dehydrogenase family protein n=1 Tax=Ornithinimicrobium faecis TaxID=2934158 RepID=A0ABY4YRD4_9MICO|nr:acyl-CoA dehydrogenase family protein [Ornithinimicrobium sp. HY1793]USQ79259.1 acyl-CoA dehydrogenase family protein [Ornithinimicrobium sp. HY1793]
MSMQPSPMPESARDVPDGSDLGRALGTDFFGLDDLLTDTERALRDGVRRWCDEEVVPRAPDYWEAAEFPRDLVPGYADTRVAGAAIQGFGCAGVSPLAEGMMCLELARGDGSIATLNAVHSGLAMASVHELGSAEQRERWLPAMARVELLGAVALTEPTHGSDVVSLETTARRDGDHWVLDGAKRWIGNGSVCDLAVVWARDDAGDVGGFVVEAPQETDGWDAQVITGKISNRGVRQAHIRLDGVRVPADNRLAEARTFADTNRVLMRSRQTVAWEAVGHAVGAYEGALTYALRREQFGRPLARNQLIQDGLARMVTLITSMQLMCTRMSQLQERGECTIEHAAMAKLHCTEGAREVVAIARDMLGGNGILLDHHVGRHFADVEAVYTYEGSRTVQSLLVGRAVTGMSAFA